MTERIKKQFIDARDVLDQFISDDRNFERIAAAGQLMVDSLKNGGKIMSCGNGGSMCDAMHFAEELTGRFRENRDAIGAISMSDPSHMSCVGNDYGFDHIFSRYVEGVGREGDVMLGISTSGNSANVIKAAEAARAKGIKVVGLTGKDGGRLAPLCDVEIRIPWMEYADRVQEMHIKSIHCLIDYIEQNMP